MASISQRNRVLLVIQTICLVLVFTFSAAINAKQLSSVKEQVSISAWLANEEEPDLAAKFYVNEQVKLYIEVSTPTWFSAGTRISYIDVPNAIVKQSNQLATNYTTREKGQTWSKQRWEITLFAQQVGRYEIPPTTVSVTVADENRQKLALEFVTPRIMFEAVTPTELADPSKPWFSATKARIHQTWQKSDDVLKVGDSITRTVMIDATDTLSIFLPSTISTDSTEYYQNFAAPNQLSDQQSRGSYHAKRVEQRTYVVQKGGELVFPEQQFVWWNSKTKTQQVLTLPEHRFQIKHTFVSFVQQYQKAIVVALSALGGAIILIGWMIRYYRHRPLPELACLLNLLRLQHWPQVRAVVYQRLRNKTGLLALSGYQAHDQWQRHSQQLQTEVTSRYVVTWIWFQMKNRANKSRKFVFKCLNL
ncbi:BatD family protein [Vibrio tapetis]|uniref:BatD n=1 Tax=Vibrio tapetis subsp. tapetis TaxID=1671868 RepID=A0A2N8ZIP1_9VIBR|nr:BatD family protein [Vibrio tapetis]SON51768.1 conserved exported protein of unknown function [Vibrio tapetis subsp. tapetis]